MKRARSFGRCCRACSASVPRCWRVRPAAADVVSGSAKGRSSPAAASSSPREAATSRSSASTCRCRISTTAPWRCRRLSPASSTFAHDRRTRACSTASPRARRWSSSSIAANNRPGFGYTVINVTQELYDQGVRSLADFGKLKGKKVGVGALGSINQYNCRAGAAEGRARSRQGRAVDRQRAAAGPHEDARAEAGRRHRSRLPVRLLRAEQQMGPDRRQRRPGRAERGHLRRSRCARISCRRTATWWSASPWPICRA